MYGDWASFQSIELLTQSQLMIFAASFQLDLPTNLCNVDINRGYGIARCVNLVWNNTTKLQETACFFS
jgi:hypothetical protein